MTTCMRRAAHLVACLVLGTTVAVGAAHAQQEPDDGGEAGELVVTELTGVLLPGEDFRLRVRVHNRTDAELEDLRLVGSVHGRATSRLALQQALDGGEVGVTIHPFAENLDPLGPMRSRVVEVEQSALQMGFANPADKFGVYPVRLQLQRFDEVLDEVVTSIVLAPDEAEQPVAVSFVLPLDAPPARRPDGTYEGARLPPLGVGGRLQVLAESVAARPDARLTVATSALLLDQVVDLAGGFQLAGDPPRTVDADSTGAQQARRFLERVGSALEHEGVEHIALPYGPADLVALVRGGLPADATRLISHGRAVAEQHTGVTPTPAVLWPPDGLDRPTLTQALGADTTAIILSERYLAIAAERDLPFSPSPVRQLRTPTGTGVTALVPDPWLEEILTRDVTTAATPLAVQRVLAETAMVFFERPFAASTRGLLLAPPQVWEVPRALPAALLDSFAQAPWLEPVTVTGLRAAVAPEPDTVQLDYPDTARSRELPEAYVTGLRNARVDLAGLTGVLENDDATPVRYDSMLEAATSVHYRRPPLSLEGREMLRTVRSTVSDLHAAVEVVDSLPVILSSIEGQVPVTLRNDADTPLRIRLRLETQRYEFANGPVTEPFTLDSGETLTRAFQARALAPGGTHQIRVVVEDAEGALSLAEGTVVVRSTAVSLTALVITVAAGIFLAGWWLRESSRRRHARAAAPPRVPTAV